MLEIWESFTWEPIEMHELDSLVVAVLHSRGKGRGSGLELDRRSAMLWRLDQDRALSLTFYRDPDEAPAAARAQAYPQRRPPPRARPSERRTLP